MSTTNIASSRNASSSVAYICYGAEGSDMKAEHLDKGTDRMAAMQSTCGSPQEFIDRARGLAQQYDRQVEMFTIIQSFPKEDFDRNERADVYAANAAGVDLAFEAFPDCDHIVVTHTDSVGGMVHNHIGIMNHDNVTGQVPRKNRWHKQLSRINDKVMEKLGLNVIDREATREKNRNKEWATERENVAKEKNGQFFQSMGDKIHAALQRDDVTDRDTFEAALAEKGIKIVVKGEDVIKPSKDGSFPGSVSERWQYVAYDDGSFDDSTTGRGRNRRRYASKFSNDVTARGVERVFEEKKLEIQREAERLKQEQDKQRKLQMHAGRQAANPEPVQAPVVDVDLEPVVIDFDEIGEDDDNLIIDDDLEPTPQLVRAVEKDEKKVSTPEVSKEAVGAQEAAQQPNESLKEQQRRHRDDDEGTTQERQKERQKEQDKQPEQVAQTAAQSTQVAQPEMSEAMKQRVAKGQRHEQNFKKPTKPAFQWTDLHNGPVKDKGYPPRGHRFVQTKTGFIKTEKLTEAEQAQELVEAQDKYAAIKKKYLPQRNAGEKMALARLEKNFTPQELAMPKSAKTQDRVQRVQELRAQARERSAGNRDRDITD